MVSIGSSKTVRRTARKRCLSGYGWGGFAFARPRRSSETVRSPSGGELLRCTECRRICLVRKPLTCFSGTCAARCLHGGPKPTPQDPGKGEACCDGSFHPRSAPRLFRPCRTFQQNTKAPPPARIDTLRDPSGGGRRFRIRQVFGVGKIWALIFLRGNFCVCGDHCGYRRTWYFATLRKPRK